MIILIFYIAALVLILKHLAATNSLFDTINVIFTLFNFRYIKINFGCYQEAFFDGFSRYFIPLKIIPKSSYGSLGGISSGKFDHYDISIGFLDQFMLPGALYFISIFIQIWLKIT